MVTAVATTDVSQEALMFLQRRAARFGLFAGAVSGVFFIFRVVAHLGRGRFELLLRPSLLLHLAAIVCFGVVWHLCRAGTRTARFVRTTEALGVIGAAISYELMGAFLPAVLRPEMIVMLALSLGLVARAVYVPSTARHTFWLVVGVGLPLLPITYLTYYQAGPGVWELVRLFDPGIAAHKGALALTISAVVWWSLVVMTCTMTSRVIYGLRKEVRDIRRLGQYTLESKLGEGGMGVVYRARHSMLRRPTAVKLLPPEKVGEQSLARFEKEVQLTAQLSHANTITVFDYGRTPDGVFYYAMEYLDGSHLGDVVAIGGALPSARVVHILAQAAGALAEAHGVGLIHRDIKPANLMLCEQGGEPDVVKVLDFGLVKELSRDVSTSLTTAGTITGTPQYLAPEAIVHPDRVDARSDIYALGAVGYFLVTGEHVFIGNTLVEVCGHHLHTAPIPPSERLGAPVPPDLEALILACLEKEPGRRPQNAADLLERLRGLDVGTWSAADARRWWSEHGSALKAGREDAATSATGATVSIDLEGRRPT